ncbi:hypothetical protein, partial [Zavarzinella formosa]|uniref:hypothetical protein n=1 Tax=Zavarzinella formosa TaxID=360055 RepID=UPI00187DCE4C
SAQEPCSTPVVFSPGYTVVQSSPVCVSAPVISRVYYSAPTCTTQTYFAPTCSTSFVAPTCYTPSRVYWHSSYGCHTRVVRWSHYCR